MEILFFIISLGLLFLMHKIICLLVGKPLKEMYDFYFADEFGAAYFSVLNLTFLLVIFVTLIALNNTYWNFKYLFF